jgi:hypothetical protein
VIATAPVSPWHGDRAVIRAHGDAVLRGLGIPPVPAPGLLAQAISPVREDPFSSGLNAGLRSLLGAVWNRDPAEAERAGLRLTGLGGGSTPLGDDYVLGAALCVWSLGEAAGFDDPDRAPWLRVLIPADAARRTSSVSTALLAAGSRGRAPRPLHGILEPGGPDLVSALSAVIAIGATSGRGCAAAIGATALLLGDAAVGRNRRPPTRIIQEARHRK